jgi:hypothetical protein
MDITRASISISPKTAETLVKAIDLLEEFVPGDRKNFMLKVESVQKDLQDCLIALQGKIFSGE